MKITSLNNNKDFRKGYSKGKSFVSPCLVTYIMKNNLGINRLGVTASKKIGNAVQRNRARRIIKQSYYLLNSNLSSGYDFVFVARVKTTKVKMNQVKASMYSHFVSGGLINNSAQKNK